MKEIETEEGLTVMRSWVVKCGHLVIWSFGHFQKMKPCHLGYSIIYIIYYTIEVLTHFFFAFWPNDQMTKWPYWLFWMCLFLNKVLLCLRTLCQHGRRQAAPRHIKLRSVCKASWRSDAVLMPRGGASTEIGHRMWRRQGAQAPITTIVRAIDAILIRGSMAHGELWKTQTDFRNTDFFEHKIKFLNTDYIFWTWIFFEHE